MEKITYVFGHKNPDTDSVVSAYAFARLKQLCGNTEYTAARAGSLNPQTEYIFKKFGVTPPVFVSDLTPKVKYYMSEGVVTVDERQSLQFASALMQKNEFSYLCVVDSEGKYKSLLHYSVFAKNLINSLNPEHHIKVFTNRRLLMQSLGALPASGIDTLGKNISDVEECTIVVGATDIESFCKTIDSRPDQIIIAITGDREDIQKAAIERKVYCLIISGGRTISPELIELAKKNDVCVLISPFDTASTSMLTAYSVPVSKISDNSITAVKAGERVSKIKQNLHNSSMHALPVVDDSNRIIGIITENDLLQESAISVSLVDHNELSQAVDGIENYTIREIIDHHRIGAITTKYPVTFINKVLGSTSTIIAGLYEEAGVEIDKNTAGLLLSGILSDTLILKSATATETDRIIASKLAQIAGLEIQSFGEEILGAGCNVYGRTAAQLVSQDLKEYSEGKLKFTVSQIEVTSLRDQLERRDEFLSELEKQRSDRKALFSAILVTDITDLNSFLFLKADPKSGFSVGFPQTEENVYFLKGIVSRKKQLVPILTEAVLKL